VVPDRRARHGGGHRHFGLACYRTGRWFARPGTGAASKLPSWPAIAHLPGNRMLLGACIGQYGITALSDFLLS
jgi:hypothetical protein